MKKIFSIIILSGIIFKNAEARTTPVPDTLAYLQAIVNNKAAFIGQPFSTLVNGLQLGIKYFDPIRGNLHDNSKETSTSYGFNFAQNASEIYLTYPRLRISWVSPLSANQSDIIWENNNGGGWNITAATFYSTAIISDIQIRE